MCGITGQLGGSQPEGIELSVKRMADRLHHRGPDDGGVWVDESATVGLGHRRLSILDLSSAGHQPMTSASGRFVLAYNGEIYNHLDLRKQLEGEGDALAWRGHSDTETLLACIEAWGMERSLQASVGMFAFALWDRAERALILARDRIGEKPLYYGWQGDSGRLVNVSKILDTRVMNLIDIGTTVRARREALGLSQGQLAHLSGLSRQTLVGLENGSLHDLGVNRAGQVLSVLGLDAQQPSTAARRRKRGLLMATRNANVSYARQLQPAVLARMLVSGDVPAPYAPHLTHLLDEAPLPMVVMAVEEAAAEAQVPPRKVWRNVARLAKSLSAHRKDVWA